MEHPFQKNSAAILEREQDSRLDIKVSSGFTVVQGQNQSNNSSRMRGSRFLGVSPDKLKRPRTERGRGGGGCIEADPSCVRMTNPFERPFSLQIPISTGAQGSLLSVESQATRGSALIRTAESRANSVSCGNRELERVRMGWRCCLFAL